MLRQVDSDEDGSSVESTLRSSGTPDKTLDMSKTDPLTGRLDDLEKGKLNQLLGQWEEPDRVKSGMVSRAQTSPSKKRRSISSSVFWLNHRATAIRSLKFYDFEMRSLSLMITTPSPLPLV
jgi:hypothetical protein